MTSPSASVQTTLDADIVVIGGGSAGSTAAIAAQQALPRGRVILLEKAHIKRSGAIAIGMDGLNNAIVPGHATPEQYVKEITMANDGIVHQRALLEYANHSYAMLQQLDAWGVKFQKTLAGDFDVKHAGWHICRDPCQGRDLPPEPSKPSAFMHLIDDAPSPLRYSTVSWSSSRSRSRSMRRSRPFRSVNPLPAPLSIP
jgi:FAD binding domain